MCLLGDTSTREGSCFLEATLILELEREVVNMNGNMKMLKRTYHTTTKDTCLYVGDQKDDFCPPVGDLGAKKTVFPDPINDFNAF